METLYDETQYKAKNSILKNLFLSFCILMLLAAVRFVDHMLWWQVTKLEIKNSQTGRIEDISFIGLSTHEEARGKLLDFSKTHIYEKSIVSYYDFLHPLVFLIDNRGAKNFVNLGIMNVYPEPGITSLFFLPSEIIQTKKENTRTKALYFGTSLFPRLFDSLAKQLSTGKDGRGLSFILNPFNDAKYLHIPYLIYFFLPLLIILVLSANYPGFFISFFYYVELFLLFDFKKVFFIGPFSWLTNLLGINVSHTAAVIISTIMVTTFLAAGFWGIFHKHKRAAAPPAGYYLTSWGKALIVFFLLLPLVLRF